MLRENPVDARRRAVVAGIVVLLLVGLEFGLRAARAVPALGGLDTAALFAEYPLERHVGFHTLERNYDGTLWQRPFRTNEHGFRSPSIPVERDRPDELRIFLMGTCVTLGEMDETSDGYSILARTIQHEVQARYPELVVRVVNAAVPGSFETQYRVYFEQVVSAFGPDLVIIDNGAAQIVNPAGMLQEYRARAGRRPRVAEASLGWGVRQQLYEFFSRSVLISHFYSFRRNQDALFEKYFYRRPTVDRHGPDGVRGFVADVLEPSLARYRADLDDLYAALTAETEVISYTFPHALPDRGFEDLDPAQRQALGVVQLMESMPSSMGLEQVWQIFRRSYREVVEITRSVAAARGVRYVDLMDVPELRAPRLYRPVWYYYPRSSGSTAKGEFLAQVILENYRVEVGESGVALREVGP